MKFLLQHKTETEFILLRVLGASGEVELPAFISVPASPAHIVANTSALPSASVSLPEDTPAHITEIAAYAFSEGYAPLPERKLLFLYNALNGDLSSCADCSDAEMERLLSDAVICERLLTLSLPSSVQKIGRYAFYNCDHLSSVSFYSTTADLGQGLFTGCSGIRELSVVVDEGRRSTLFETLMELRYHLRVSYYIEETASREDFSQTASALLKYRLIFPEFYENADENTPARITTRDLRGSGLMYRNCFANTQFQIKRYDALFPYAETLEPEDVAAELALCRLEVPSGLSEEYAVKYRDFLSGHLQAFADVLLLHLAHGLCSLSDLRSLFTSSFPSDKFPQLCGGLIDVLSARTEQSPQVQSLLPLLMDLNAPASDPVPLPSAATSEEMQTDHQLSPVTAKKRRRHFEL